MRCEWRRTSRWPVKNTVVMVRAASVVAADTRLAWPTGQGYGRGLIKDVLAAADESGATLLLQAGNRYLAEYFYVPLGFAVQQGEETAKRPWIERTPARAVTPTGSVASL